MELEIHGKCEKNWGIKMYGYTWFHWYHYC